MTDVEVWERCTAEDEPVTFFPVRHHSPACAWHIRKKLESYRPDAVLIEGPSDSNHLISHLGAPVNQAPLCLYYSYIDKKQDFRSACYYPLLDFSPELCAIRYAEQEGIYTEFIDLPYGRMSLLEKEREGKGEPEGDAATPSVGKKSFYEDYYFRRSAFIARLCAKEGCRHQGELWEKLFELRGPELRTEDFLREFLAFCHYARVEYPEALLEAEGCLEREDWMFANIRAAAAKYERVLVVTGGFHTQALALRLWAAKAPAATPKAPKLPGEGKAWIIPYSFAESDQLAGYASGMPYPAFYQQAYREMRPPQSWGYDRSVLTYLATIGSELRRHKETTSIADEVAAAIHARGLAELRGKRQQGVYELLDAVRSVYVKGAFDMAAARVMNTAEKLLRGDARGLVKTDADAVPLLKDFRDSAQKFHLKMDTVIRQEVVLGILSKELHRQASIFLHRLDFLEVGFATLIKGPDYKKRSTGTVRETWNYAVSASVEAAVIDKSVWGGTLEEAAATVLSRSRAEATGAGKFSSLLIEAAIMDLTEQVDELLQAMTVAIVEDGSFASLVLAARNLLFLDNAKWLLGLKAENFGEEMLRAVYLKACSLLPTLDTGNEEEDSNAAKALKTLNEIAGRDGFDAELLREALLDLLGRAAPEPPPALLGAAAGLLYSLGGIELARIIALAESYFYGAGERVKSSGRFLSGIFLTAWDLLFAGDAFLRGISHVLNSLVGDEFLSLLPDLRLAFSVFTPSQVNRIASEVAKMLNVETANLFQEAKSDKLFGIGRELDIYAREACHG